MQLRSTLKLKLKWSSSFENAGNNVFVYFIMLYADAVLCGILTKVVNKTSRLKQSVCEECFLI